MCAFTVALVIPCRNVISMPAALPLVAELGGPVRIVPSPVSQPLEEISSAADALVTKLLLSIMAACVLCTSRYRGSLIDHRALTSPHLVTVFTLIMWSASAPPFIFVSMLKLRMASFAGIVGSSAPEPLEELKPVTDAFSALRSKRRRRLAVVITLTPS